MKNKVATPLATVGMMMTIFRVTVTQTTEQNERRAYVLMITIKLTLIHVPLWYTVTFPVNTITSAPSPHIICRYKRNAFLHIQVFFAVSSYSPFSATSQFIHTDHLLHLLT